MKTYNYLNLGCGDTFFRDWTNIDFRSSDKNVIQHDLTTGLPFADKSFNVVYHSHVLEHLNRHEARRFLKECQRVLKPGGVMRIVVPDQEQIARNYILALENAMTHPTEINAANYEWAAIEMLDQLTRTQTIGEMGAYCKQEHIINFEHVLGRVGPVLLEWRKTLQDGNTHKARRVGLVEKITYKSRQLMRRSLGISDREWYEMQYNRTGERHKWMYDKYSLGFELQKLGFENIVQITDDASAMADWKQYKSLDFTASGNLRKPDSLIMEAQKKDEIR